MRIRHGVRGAALVEQLNRLRKVKTQNYVSNHAQEFFKLDIDFVHAVNWNARDPVATVVQEICDDDVIAVAAVLCA